MSVVHPNRIKQLQSGSLKGKTVLYWMQRDKRVYDNWALLHAQDLALQNGYSLMVCFNYIGDFPSSNIRQYDFLFQGLYETEKSLKKLNISFRLLNGTPKNELPKLILKEEIAILVTDFSPLRFHRRRTKKISNSINIPFYIVDSNNIVPIWVTSEKQEWGAYTIRPKIQKHLGEFLTEIPKLKRHSVNINSPGWDIDWPNIYKKLNVDNSVVPVDWLLPGEKAAQKQLEYFSKLPIENYTNHRNNPNQDVLSNMSPFLHFGHISSQRVALNLSQIDTIENKSILEQLIVRRELAANFCFYNNIYDSFDGFPNWAKESLYYHTNDKREYLYPPEAFETAETHDDLWNAAQLQMVYTGKMHTYMRMYWAKKILEWSPSPEIALQTAIDLNDKYELDGRDANGYTGIAWSLGGVHDRPWFERPVYGKIRYMSYNGCKNKFDISEYIANMNLLKSL